MNSGSSPGVVLTDSTDRLNAARTPDEGDEPPGLALSTISLAGESAADLPPDGCGPATSRRKAAGGRRRSDLKARRPSAGSPSRLLSLPEAAAYLGLSWWTTREMVMRGAIPAVRLPAPRARDGRTLRRILIDRIDLDALITKWKDVN